MQIEETRIDGVSLLRNENFVDRAIKVTATHNNMYPILEHLRIEIAAKHDVPVSNVILGAGITGVFRTVLAGIADMGYRSINKDPERYSGLTRIIDQSSLHMADFNADTRVIVNPSNPFGSFDFAEHTDTLNIYDEAYIDYYPSSERISMMKNINSEDDLVVMRTFSKAHGLASIRVGYAVVSDNLCKAIRLQEGNYCISAISASTAQAALQDDEFVKQTRIDTANNRGRLESGLRALGYNVIVSCANFVVADVPDVEGFTVRDVSSYAGLDGYRRITVSSIEVITNYLNKLGEENG